MLYIMTNDEKQDRINSGVRWISNAVFGMCSDNKIKYAKAYDKLHSRFLLDYGYSLNDRLKSSKTKDKTIFDVLVEGELEMLLQSLYRLENMYTEVMESKGRVDSIKKRKELCYANI